MSSARFVDLISAACFAALCSTCLTSCVPQVPENAARRQPSTIEITSQSGVSQVIIPGGEFMMGSDHGRPDESPRHRVVVGPLAIDKFEVTQQQFADLELPDPSQFKSPDRPVEQIRWVAAAEYCNERSHAEGLDPCYDAATLECDFVANGYRLPTEAEWEYAARAGSDEDRPLGEAAKSLASRACYAGNSRNKTSSVGTKRANAWGLHDMLGNVAEWCHDIYAESYYAESPREQPRGPSAGDKRVVRGGSWRSSDQSCRVSCREGRVAGFTDACFTGNTLGFRCVRRLNAAELRQLQEAN